MISSFRHLIIFLSVFSLFACAEPAPGPESSEIERLPQDPLPPPMIPPSLAVASRGPRRLTVSELERSWESIGGFEPNTIRLPVDLARSLGEPDWLSTTEVNLEPSPLFMKFMIDLSSILCQQILVLDAQRPVEQRILLRYADDIDRNIRYLRLRFWALDTAPDDTTNLSRLRTVYDSATQGRNSSFDGWFAVCIALSTAPEFLLY